MKELIIAFEEFTKSRRGDGLIPVKVTSVDKQTFLFDAEDGDGNTYLDVRMNAAPGKRGVLAVPALNSTAMITDLGNQAQQWVLVCADILSDVFLVVDDTFLIHIDTKKVRLTGDLVQQAAVLGPELNTNLTSLLTTLNNLVTTLNVFAAANLAASVGTLAPLAPAYSALNGSLPGLLSSLGTLQGQLSNHLSDNVTLS